MSEKTKISSVIKDALILFAITLVAALLLSFVNEITKEPIAKQEAKAKAEAYKHVFESAVTIDMGDNVLVKRLENSKELLTEASLSTITIVEAGIAKDSKGKIIGYVMTITSPNGYGGDITITMGYSIDKKVTNIEFLTLNETAGFGLKAKEPAYKDQYIGKSGESLLIPADSSEVSSESNSIIEGISGATRSSNAILEAVNAGIIFAKDLLNASAGGAK